MPEVRIIVTADGEGIVSGMTVTQDDCSASDFCLPGHKAVVDKRVFLYRCRDRRGRPEFFVRRLSGS